MKTHKIEIAASLAERLKDFLDSASIMFLAQTRKAEIEASLLDTPELKEERIQDRILPGVKTISIMTFDRCTFTRGSHVGPVSK
jgi:hypothetical protein